MDANVPVCTADNKAKLDYLKELLTDRAVLSHYPGIYIHVGKILEKEILKVRSALFAAYGIYSISDKDLPAPEGPKVNLTNRVYMPSGEKSSFNFVGRILGPDGSTAKCLQHCLGVKIMVRGRGSMRDRKKEEANMGKPNWEHLNDKLHVVLTVEDYESRAQARLNKASEYISLFLKESLKTSDRDDKVKQMQLMELSFRREPRTTWPTNYGGLFPFGLPPKPGAFLPNPNALGYSYCYPPPTGPPPPPLPHSHTLFSPLNHNPCQHAPHHYNQQGPPPAHPAGMTPAPGSFAPIPGGHQPHLGVTQAHGVQLGNLTHSFASTISPGLNPTMLMGHPGPNGLYTNGPLNPTGNTITNRTIGPSQPGPTAPNAGTPIPGALSMTSMNYWPNGASVLGHLATSEFSVPAHFPSGPEQTSPEGFSTSHLTNGSQPSGLCSVYMSATPGLNRAHEDVLSNGLLNDFVPHIGGKDLNLGPNGRPSSVISSTLTGLYGPIAPASDSQTASALKITPNLMHTGSPPPPPSANSVGTSPQTSSSLTAKQGLKPRCFQKSNHTGYTSPVHSVSGGTTRNARNTVVAVKIGSKEKTAENMTNGSRHSALEMRAKNNATVSVSANNRTAKQLPTPQTSIDAPSADQSSESGWHKMESHSNDTEEAAVPTSTTLDTREEPIFDLSLIPDTTVSLSEELKGMSITLENDK